MDCDLASIVNGSGGSGLFERKHRLPSPAACFAAVNKLPELPSDIPIYGQNETGSTRDLNASTSGSIRQIRPQGVHKCVTCSDCKSTFTSSAGLRNHRNKHCVGGMNHYQDGRQVSVRVRCWNQRLQELDTSSTDDRGSDIANASNRNLQTALDTDVRMP